MALVCTPQAFAGPGEWDYLGSSGFTESAPGTYSSKVVSSGGGYFKTCATSNYPGNVYALREDDPGSNPSDDIDVAYAGAEKYYCHTWNVSQFVDGDNGKAELYLVTDQPAVKVEFWD